MSKQLESQVWQSALDAELKPVAAVMADMGNDDGLGIYPSVEYLAWLLSRSERAVQNALKKLMKIGVLDRVGCATGGRGLTPRYRFSVDNLPERPSWKESRKGASVAPFTNLPKGADFSIKGATNDQKGANSAPDPLDHDPSVNRETRKRGKPDRGKPEPPQIAPPFHGQEFLQILSEFEALRHRIKHPLVGDGRKRMFDQFKVWGEPVATEALTVSVTNDYRGVFLPKNRQNGNGYGSNGNGKAKPGENIHMQPKMSQAETDERMNFGK